MYTITTELGEFVGEDEREAKAKLVKAKREQFKRDKQLEADRTAARTSAIKRAFVFLNEWAKGEGCRRIWRFEPKGTGMAKRFKDLESPVPSWHETEVYLETQDGKTALRTTSKFLGLVTDSAGWDGLIFLQPAEGQVECYAVGICEGAWHIELVHGITPEWFGKENSCD